MNSINFFYNGQRFDEIGVYLVSVDAGLKETPFLSEREIISETVAGNDLPYVYDHRRSPLTINLTLSTLEGLWTFEKRREVARLLDTNSFEEFYSEDNISKKYYLSYVGGINLTHNANEQGYITVQMQNISPFSYSPVYTTNHLIENAETKIIEFANNGDNDLFPEVWIKKVGAGNFTITNLSNGGEVFEFVDLVDGETIYVDNKNRDIETDIPLTYRYDNFNNNYLKITNYSINRLQITGDCELTFRYQFEIKG